MARGGKRPAAGSSIFDETLLSSSQVGLFGRVFQGLTIDTAWLQRMGKGAKAGKSGSLAGKLKPEDDPKLARIYGFTYEGSYYKLDAPYVFLVHGDGTEIDVEDPSMSDVGVEMLGEKFLKEVRVWSYDKVDFSVRIQIVSGWLEEILLDAAMGASSNMTSGELTPRIDMSSRIDMSNRIDMASRIDMAMRSRLKSR